MRPVAERTRDLTFLVNPTAGKGRAARAAAAAVRRLRDAGFGVEVRAGSDAAEAESIARSAVAAGCGGLVVCGGDGMVHLGCQAVAGTGVPLGVVPAGTGNDAARTLGIPTRPEAAADVVVASRRRRIDLARAGDRYFVTVLAAGFDALVNERANRMRWPRGQMRYNLATLAELRTFRPLRYTLELDGEARRLEAMLVAVGNGPSFGGGLRIAEGARVDDGLLDVVVIRPISKPELVRTYPKLFRGTHVRHPAYVHHRVRSVTVAASGVVGYADGERLGALPLTVSCAAGALEVFA